VGPDYQWARSSDLVRAGARVRPAF
jgi:hypothetical protein